MFAATAMKFGAATKADMAVTRQFARADVTTLWADDWWDGPLRGMAQVAGTRCLFDMIDRDVLGDEQEDRAYWLIRLDNEQLQEEEHWHELFCQNVGTHFDFTGRQPLAKEAVDLDVFYEAYRKRRPPDYRDNEVLGWFQL